MVWAWNNNKWSIDIYSKVLATLKTHRGHHTPGELLTTRWLFTVAYNVWQAQALYALFGNTTVAERGQLTADQLYNRFTDGRPTFRRFFVDSFLPAFWYLPFFLEKEAGMSPAPVPRPRATSSNRPPGETLVEAWHRLKKPEKFPQNSVRMRINGEQAFTDTRLDTTAAHVPVSVPRNKRLNCRFCSTASHMAGVEAKAKPTQNMCQSCGVNLCKGQCFYLWHTAKDLNSAFVEHITSSKETRQSAATSEVNLGSSPRRRSSKKKKKRPPSARVPMLDSHAAPLTLDFGRKRNKKQQEEEEDEDDVDEEMNMQ